jgi:hypothetical protein
LFSEVSLIRDNQVKEVKGNSLIIKGLNNQVMKNLIITDNQFCLQAHMGFFSVVVGLNYYNNSKKKKQKQRRKEEKKGRNWKGKERKGEKRFMEEEYK